MEMRTYILILAMVICQISFAQGFKMKEFKSNLNDGSAFHAPMDAEGHPCGLIKVRTDNPDLQFKGDVVGEVENKMNEYWVYVSQKCKQLKVNHPNYLPLVVPFSNYGIEISSKATYIMTLEETKYKKEKTGVTITVNPDDAELFIDDMLIDNQSGNGYYQLYLPKGEHVCKLSKEGYRPNVQAVQTGKESQTISVELESVMAELEVKCKTATAEIYVDDELKGNGSWKGNLLAGEHKIEARQQNFNSHIQTIILTEKESKALVVPELKRSMGKLRVETEPSNMPVIIDGKTVGTSPCTIEIESGKHYVSCKSYGVNQNRSDIEVRGDQICEVKLKIQYGGDWLKDYYQRAYKGNTKDILFLASQACRTENYQEAVFWIERHPQGETIVNYWQQYGEQLDINMYWQCDWIQVYSETGNPERALELYPLWKEYAENHGDLFLNDLEMKYIGDGFFKKKEIDKAILCYEKSGKDGYEGLGDCYKAKGNMQLAANYYRKCLSIESFEGKNRVEQKLKELE